MVEMVHADKAETRKLDVGYDEQRERQRSCKGYHVDPASGSCRGHAEAREQRAPEPKPKKHDINDLRRMSLVRTIAQSRGVKNGVQ